jgi:NTE family protein
MDLRSLACVAACAAALSSGAYAAPPADCTVADFPHPAATAMRQPPDFDVGLALGSGSLHALSEIGVIEALEAAGVNVRVVSGTSAGAIVGALWASGLDGRGIEQLALAGGWDEGSLSLSRDGLLSNAPLRRQLEERFAGRPIESWPRRFGAVATNVANGHRRILMAGDAAAAVQASSAVPVLYGPVTIGGERLADGALVEPVPVATARALGAEFVIAVDVAYRPYEDAAGGIVGLGFQAMHILVNSLADRQRADADFVVRLDVHHLMPCGNAALIGAGREVMARLLPDLEAAMARKAAGYSRP